MQEMKIVAMRVLKNLKLELPADHCPVELISELVLKPKNGIRLKISERSN